MKKKNNNSVMPQAQHSATKDKAFAAFNHFFPVIKPKCVVSHETLKLTMQTAELHDEVEFVDSDDSLEARIQDTNSTCKIHAYFDDDVEETKEHEKDLLKLVKVWKDQSSNTSEIIVVNFQEDKTLQLVAAKLSSIYNNSRRLGFDDLVSTVFLTSVIIAESMGGLDFDPANLLSRYNQLRIRFQCDTNELQLGRLMGGPLLHTRPGAGLVRHRAITLHVFLNRYTSYVVRMETGKGRDLTGHVAWNIVSTKDVEYVVDLMYEVGQMYPCESPQARLYIKSVARLIQDQPLDLLKQNNLVPRYIVKEEDIKISKVLTRTRFLEESFGRLGIRPCLVTKLKKPRVPASQFILDLQNLYSIQHDNVSTTLGGCLSRSLQFSFLTSQISEITLLEMVDRFRVKIRNAGFHIMLGLLRGLTCLHRRKITHGSLTPLCVMFKSFHKFDPVINLLTAHRPDQLVETYRAPERDFEDNFGRVKVDVYSFGLIVYLIYSDNAPFENYSVLAMKRLKQKKNPPLKMRGTVELEIYRRACEANKKLRYTSEELLALIEDSFDLTGVHLEKQAVIPEITSAYQSRLDAFREKFQKQNLLLEQHQKEINRLMRYIKYLENRLQGKESPEEVEFSRGTKDATELLNTIVCNEFYHDGVRPTRFKQVRELPRSVRNHLLKRDFDVMMEIQSIALHSLLKSKKRRVTDSILQASPRQGTTTAACLLACVKCDKKGTQVLHISSSKKSCEQVLDYYSSFGISADSSYNPGKSQVLCATLHTLRDLPNSRSRLQNLQIVVVDDLDELVLQGSSLVEIEELLETLPETCSRITCCMQLSPSVLEFLCDSFSQAKFFSDKSKPSLEAYNHAYVKMGDDFESNEITRAIDYLVEEKRFEVEIRLAEKKCRRLLEIYEGLLQFTKKPRLAVYCNTEIDAIQVHNYLLQNLINVTYLVAMGPLEYETVIEELNEEEPVVILTRDGPGLRTLQTDLVIHYSPPFLDSYVLRCLCLKETRHKGRCDSIVLLNRTSDLSTLNELEALYHFTFSRLEA